MKFESPFSIGDVVGYSRNGLPIHMERLRYAEILSIKVDKAGMWYEMSDDPIHDSSSQGPRMKDVCVGPWVSLERIVQRLQRTSVVVASEPPGSVGYAE